MGIQDKNTENIIRLKNHPKSKTLREFDEFDIELLVHCYKAKCTLQWAEKHFRKDVCKLTSKLSLVRLF